MWSIIFKFVDLMIHTLMNPLFNNGDGETPIPNSSSSLYFLPDLAILVNQ